MLKRLTLSFRSPVYSRLTLTRPQTVLSSRYTTQKDTVERDIPPEKRFISIVVAFAVGCSVYFFLDDPKVPRKREPPFLSPWRFSPVSLVSSEDSSPSTKLIELTVPGNFLPERNQTFSPIWSVYIKDDDIQVERPYTPLYGVSEDGRMRFWIKKYPHGEVGRWIHSKKQGEKVELRGPLTTWQWKEDTWDEVVMISGGTGITPFIQLFNTKIKKLPPNSKTKFTLIHCSRTPGELPPPELVNPLTAFAQEHPERFKFHVFVDEDNGTKAVASTPSLNVGRINEKSLRRYINGEKAVSWWKRMFSEAPADDISTKRVMFLVCGPEPMIGAIAGPYGRNLSQGPTAGILGRLGYTSDQVYKL